MTAASAANLARAAQSSEASIGIGVIGTGNRGAYLLRGAMEQPGVKVAALCDIKPDRLDSAATLAARDKPRTYTDYRRLLEQPDVGAIFIATPCDLHVEMAIAALKAGKHVYCEKPLGITPESIRELLRVARESKAIFQIGQQMRSDARLRKTIEKIHAGALGKVVMIKAQRHASEDLDHHGPSADWFFNAARSGDVIVEMSVHNLDVCNWVAASRPERAAGFGGTLVWVDDPPGRTNMDGYTVSYEYANGIKLSYTQVFFHPRGMPGGGSYYYVYTTEGAVDLTNATFYPRARDAQPVVLAEPEKTPPHAHVAAFFEAIRSGTTPFADLTVGATAALTAILGREAMYRRKVMTWPELGVPDL
ncbi:MAG: Gfo/Idh/MocA family oxidoreductase [Bryobacteraceae bacterium]|nr:Gfo/Idh/MocA family oxidoreductase [Bryobacteraceae bacterium]